MHRRSLAQLPRNGVVAGASCHDVFNWTGQPALSLPVGRDAAGLPRGVQLVGARGADALLLALGASLERGLAWAQARPQ